MNPRAVACPCGSAGLDTTRCPLCGASNQCVMAAGAGGVDDPPCWCTQVRIDRAQLARIPQAALRRACLCPACASAFPLADLPLADPAG